MSTTTMYLELDHHQLGPFHTPGGDNILAFCSSQAWSAPGAADPSRYSVAFPDRPDSSISKSSSSLTFISPRGWDFAEGGRERRQMSSRTATTTSAPQHRIGTTKADTPRTLAEAMNPEDSKKDCSTAMHSVCSSFGWWSFGHTMQMALPDSPIRADVAAHCQHSVVTRGAWHT